MSHSQPYTNPIIPGFSPDPSIVLVDGTFYLVNSTFHLFPGMPIYTSTDLLHWKQIGNALHRHSQMSLQTTDTKLCPPDSRGDVMLMTGGLYAPTIRYHKGSFYVVCTNIVRRADEEDRSENFIVSTTDIHKGEWSDPVYFEFRGIDPSLFFDDDGKVYMKGSAGPGPMTKIKMYEIDLKTGKKLTEEKKIWDGTGGIYPEGPHMYKKDSFYYLLISEGGTHSDHMITAARSKDIWGPYESYENNPILTARGTDNYIQYTGHSDFFQDQQGRWFGVCLGVRLRDGHYIMGRETFLTTGSWDEGEWPSMDRVLPNPILCETGQEFIRSDASKPALTAVSGVDFVYIRDAILENHNIEGDGTTITLVPSKHDMGQAPEPVTFVGKRQRLLEASSSVALNVDANIPGGAELKAGLAYYKDDHRYIKIYYDYSTAEIVLEVVNNARKIQKVEKRKVVIDKKVTLGVKYTEMNFQFRYSIGKSQGQWEKLGEFDSLEMIGPDFVGPVIGVFAQGEDEGVKVMFDKFEIDIV